MDTRELMETALEACRAAVVVHRTYSGDVLADEWAEKGTSDYVTHVDREAEERVVEQIRARYPGHGILAEEGTGSSGGTADNDIAHAEYVWIIDPLDGTTNFLHAYPVYSVSVAVVHCGEPVAGAVVSGATGEEWTAYKGGGAHLNGEPIHVSELREMPKALIGTGFPFKAQQLIPAYMPQFEAVLRRTSGIRRAGSAALDLCHVAMGVLDGFWELDLEPWDYAAGTLIVREAGGIVTAIDDEIELRHGGSVLAGNPVIHHELGALLNEVRRRHEDEETTSGTGSGPES